MAFLNYKGIESFNDTLIKELPQDIETLYVWNNQIRTFEHSEKLPRNLKEFYLGFNQISSFEHSEGLPIGLEILYLGGNQISSFEHSDQLPRTLKELYLGGNKISSFEHSEGLPIGLEMLHLTDNPISSFEHSENLPINLKRLIIDKPQIEYPQKILRYTQFKFEPSLKTIKFLQRYQDFVPILNEIKYNPRLERMKSKLEEEEKQIKKDPESFYKSII